MALLAATRKNIATYLDLDADQANDLARELRAAAGDHQDVDVVLEEANAILEGFGIEVIAGEGWVSHYYQNFRVLYVNLGDTYQDTIMYETDEERFLVGSWGDWVEAHEAEESGGFSEPASYSPKDWSPRG